MISKKICALLFCLLPFAVAAQIVHSGKIIFEEKTNLHKMMESWNNGEENSWGERMKKNTPKYKITNFELAFTDSTSLFTKSKTQPEADPRLRDSWMARNDNDNDYIFKDFSKAEVTACKKIFESTYLISDSLAPVQWKIDNEYKKIAGYNCRRANAIVMDSLYLIAFYTDDIVCPSGPCSTHGLPGMIMGLVVPRMHLSYFATSLTPQSEIVNAPLVGKTKKSNYKETLKMLDGAMNDWGKKWKSRILWSLQL